MKKIHALAALTVAGLAATVPAHAENGNDHGRINVAGRELSSTYLCKETVGLVPLAAPWTAQAVDDACNKRARGHHPHN